MARDDPETESLLDPAAAGDEVALWRLLDRHRERLRRMIAARLDRRLAARLDPSDVLQEALADAGRKLQQYARERPLPFYPWLRRLAAERLALAHRRHIRVAGRSVCLERPVAPTRRMGRTCSWSTAWWPAAPAPPGMSAAKSSGSGCGGARALGEGEREVLVLRYLEGLPFAEVAAVLGITENAAKVRHFRALERLRERMDGESLG